MDNLPPLQHTEYILSAQDIDAVGHQLPTQNLPPPPRKGHATKASSFSEAQRRKTVRAKLQNSIHVRHPASFPDKKGQTLKKEKRILIVKFQFCADFAKS